MGILFDQLNSKYIKDTKAPTTGASFGDRLKEKYDLAPSYDRPPADVPKETEFKEGYKEPGLLGQFKESAIEAYYQARSAFGGATQALGVKSGAEGVEEYGKSVSDKWAQKLQDNPELLAPKDMGRWKDPDFYARGIGQLIPSLGGALAAGAAGALGGGLAAGPPGALAGGLVAAGAYSVALEGGSSYNEAVELGATKQQAANVAAFVGGINGLLEVAPIGRLLTKSPAGKALNKSILKRITKTLVGDKNIMKTLAKEGGVQALAEGSTESVQEIVNNAFQMEFDENRHLFDGAIESGFFGAIGGGVAGGGMSAFNISRRGQAPAQKPTIPLDDATGKRPFDPLKQPTLLESLPTEGTSNLPPADIRMDAYKSKVAPVKDDGEIRGGGKPTPKTTTREEKKFRSEYKESTVAPVVQSAKEQREKAISDISKIERADTKVTKVTPTGVKGIVTKILDKVKYNSIYRGYGFTGQDLNLNIEHVDPKNPKLSEGNPNASARYNPSSKRVEINPNVIAVDVKQAYKEYLAGKKQSPSSNIYKTLGVYLDVKKGESLSDFTNRYIAQILRHELRHSPVTVKQMEGGKDTHAAHAEIAKQLGGFTEGELSQRGVGGVYKKPVVKAKPIPKAKPKKVAPAKPKATKVTKPRARRVDTEALKKRQAKDRVKAKEDANLKDTKEEIEKRRAKPPEQYKEIGKRAKPIVATKKTEVQREPSQFLTGQAEKKAKLKEELAEEQVKENEAKAKQRAKDTEASIANALAEKKKPESDAVQRLKSGRQERMDGTLDFVREEKRPTKEEIIEKLPDINLTKTIQSKDVYGNNITLEAGDAFTPYSLRGGKVLLQDGEAFVVSKNQFTNIQNNSMTTEVVPFDPELAKTIIHHKTSFQTHTTLQGQPDEYLMMLLQQKPEDSKIERVKVIQDAKYKQIRSKNRFEKENLTEQSIPYGVRGTLRGQGYTMAAPEALEKVSIAAKNNIELFQERKNVEFADAWVIWKTNREGNPKFLNVLFRGKTRDGKIADGLYVASPSPSQTSTLFYIDKKIVGSYYSPKNRVQIDEGKVTWEDKLIRGFSGGHFGNTGNVYANAMLTKRKTVDGKKVLMLEEDQSDWQRIVRGSIKDYMDDGMGEVEATAKTYEKYPRVPVKNWHQAMLKKVLKFAVGQKMDYLAWATGEQIQNKYNLSQVVQAITWDDKKYPGSPVLSGNRKSIYIDMTRGQVFNIQFNPSNGVIEYVSKNAPVKDSDVLGAQISEVVGTGIADKIINNKKGDISGDGLNLGGKWAINQYDKQTPNELKDMTGQDIETVEIDTDSKERRTIEEFNLEQPENRLKHGLKKTSKQPAIKITPLVKAIVNEKPYLPTEPSGAIPTRKEYGLDFARGEREVAMAEQADTPPGHFDILYAKAKTFGMQDAIAENRSKARTKAGMYTTKKSNMPNENMVNRIFYNDAVQGIKENVTKYLRRWEGYANFGIVQARAIRNEIQKEADLLGVDLLERGEIVSRYMMDPKRYDKVATKAEKKLAGIMREQYDVMIKMAEDNGILINYVENYMMGLYKNKDARLIDMFVNSKMSKYSKIAMAKKYDTPLEAEEAGLEPVFDPLLLMEIYTKILYKTIADRKVLDLLATMKDKDGNLLVQHTKDAPSDYKTINVRGLQKYKFLGTKKKLSKDGEEVHQIFLKLQDAKVHPEVHKVLDDVLNPLIPHDVTSYAALKKTRYLVLRMLLHNPMVHGWNIFSDLLDETSFNIWKTSKIIFTGDLTFKKIIAKDFNLTLEILEDEAALAGLKVPSRRNLPSDLADTGVSFNRLFSKVNMKNFMKLTGKQKFLYSWSAIEDLNTKILWENIVRHAQLYAYALTKNRMMHAKNSEVKGVNTFRILRRREITNIRNMTQIEINEAAAKYVNNLFGTMDLTTFTKSENFAISTVFLAKNWTLSNLRLVTGATGTFSNAKWGKGPLKGKNILPQALRHTASTNAELRVMQSHYIAHLVKGMFGLIVIQNLLQFIVSKWKDEEFHHTFKNEEGHHFDIDMYSYDDKGRRRYTQGVFFRYMSDYIHWIKSPPQTFRNKMEPVLKTTIETAFNQSFFTGQPIAPPGATNWEAAWMYPKYVFKSLTPYDTYGPQPGMPEDSFEAFYRATGSWVRHGIAANLLYRFNSLSKKDRIEFATLLADEDKEQAKRMFELMAKIEKAEILTSDEKLDSSKIAMKMIHYTQRKGYLQEVTDQEINVKILEGNNEEALKMIIESDRYQNVQGILDRFRKTRGEY